MCYLKSHFLCQLWNHFSSLSSNGQDLKTNYCPRAGVLRHFLFVDPWDNQILPLLENSQHFFYPTYFLLTLPLAISLSLSKPGLWLHIIQLIYWQQPPPQCYTPVFIILCACYFICFSLPFLVLCLLIAESSPGPCDDLPSASPSACRPGTWISVHGDSYHLTTEEDTIPVDHCDPRSIQPSWCDLYLHSCSSLLRFSTALYSAVESLQAK